MSFEDWRYRQAEKNAHNEILAFLVIILGMNLLVGGLVITVMVSGKPIVFPLLIEQLLNPSLALGLILTDAGFSIIFAGFVLVIHYDKQRSWHLTEIDKSTDRKNWKVSVRAADEMFDELKEEKKKS